MFIPEQIDALSYRPIKRIFKQHITVILAFCLVVTLLSCKSSGVEKKMNVIELKYDFKIFSSPAIRKLQTQNAWSFAVVRGNTNQQQDKITAVDSYLFSGKQVAGFPVMRETPYRVPPSSQLGVADINDDGQEELLVVDLPGMVWTLNEQGAPLNNNTPANPAHGFLAWPPVKLPGSTKVGDVLVLLTTNFSPNSTSINGIELIVANSGVSIPGYPQSLPTFPQLHPPIYDSTRSKIFVLLESNAIAAINIKDGSTAENFPVHSEFPDVWSQFCFFAPWEQLILSSTSKLLTSIDVNTAKQGELGHLVGERFVAVDSSDTHLYAVDDKAGQLVRFDANSRRDDIALNMPDLTSNVILRVVKPLGSNHSYILIVSSISSDPDDKVDPLFNLHATDDVKKDIAALTSQYKRKQYGATALTPVQNQDVRDNNLSMKRGYLENTLGLKKFLELMAGESLTQIQLVIDKPEGMTLELTEVVKGYTSNTDFTYSNRVFPSIHDDTASRSLRLVIPLNYADYDDDPAKEYQSMLKILEISY